MGTHKKTAVVTGAAGFLGSHLSDYLLARDYKVIGIDNLLTGNVRNIVSFIMM
jgi:dTDP-glucose 4,6-dehydratase